MTVEGTGRRERKNARTRQALADTAWRLFLEKGYDQVSVKEIADAVDISVPTVFKHVPEGKEALIFDDGTQRREAIVAAVRERDTGQTVLSALREFMAARGPFVTDPGPLLRRQTELIAHTPALRNYSRTLWIRCEVPLAEAVADALGRAVDDLTVRAVAHYVLETPQFLSNVLEDTQLVGDGTERRAALDTVFDLLENGLLGQV